MGSRVGGADAAATAAAAAHLSDVPETGLSDSGAVSAASTQRGTALDHGAAGHGAGDDSSAAFFPGLVDLVQGLTELLERILAAGKSQQPSMKPPWPRGSQRLRCLDSGGKQ